MADDNQMHKCTCCHFGNGIGVKKFDKISEKDLLDILTNESRGKKQVVGNRLKAQNDRILRLLFSLGDGFENRPDRKLSFNNLALHTMQKKGAIWHIFLIFHVFSPFWHIFLNFHVFSPFFSYYISNGA